MTRDTEAFWDRLRARIHEAEAAELSPERADARMAGADELPLSNDHIDAIVGRVTGAPAPLAARPEPITPAARPRTSEQLVAAGAGATRDWWKLAAMILAAFLFLGISAAMLPKILWPSERNSSETMGGFANAIDLLIDSRRSAGARQSAFIHVFQGTKYCLEAMQDLVRDDVELGPAAARHLDELRQLLIDPRPYEYTQSEATIVQLVSRLQDRAFPPELRAQALERVAEQARHGLLAMLYVHASRDSTELATHSDAYYSKLVSILSR